jgi:hypothetical protein
LRKLTKNVKLSFKKNLLRIAQTTIVIAPSGVIRIASVNAESRHRLRQSPWTKEHANGKKRVLTERHEVADLSKDHHDHPDPPQPVP